MYKRNDSYEIKIKVHEDKTRFTRGAVLEERSEELNFMNVQAGASGKSRSTIYTRPMPWMDLSGYLIPGS